MDFNSETDFYVNWSVCKLKYHCNWVPYHQYLSYCSDTLTVNLTAAVIPLAARAVLLQQLYAWTDILNIMQLGIFVGVCQYWTSHSTLFPPTSPSHWDPLTYPMFLHHHYCTFLYTDPCIILYKQTQKGLRFLLYSYQIHNLACILDDLERKGRNILPGNHSKQHNGAFECH